MNNVLHSLTLLTLTFVTGVQHLVPAYVALDAEAAIAAPAPPPPAPRGEHAFEIQRAHDGLFYVTAHVNGQPLRLLVDTGASMAVLTRHDARRLGLRPEASGGAMQTAGGRIDMERVTLDEVRLGKHRFEALQAAVIGADLPVSLIGQDLLKRFGSIRIEGDRLLLT